jgi:predicted aspartyl protease
VVKGTFTIHGCSVTALIDPGSTQLFMNKSRAGHLNWVGEELPYIMHVSTPLGKSVVVDQFVLSCEIQVGKEVMKVDLITRVDCQIKMV